MKIRIHTCAVTLLLLSACQAVAHEPFDPERCELQLETKLRSTVADNGWMISNDSDSFVSMEFDVSEGDKELLDIFLELRGYFPVATDPDDVRMKQVRIFFPSRDPETSPRVANQTAAPKEACQASYVSDARLVKLAVNSGAEQVLTAELK